MYKRIYLKIPIIEFYFLDLVILIHSRILVIMRYIFILIFKQNIKVIYIYVFYIYERDGSILVIHKYFPLLLFVVLILTKVVFQGR